MLLLRHTINAMARSSFSKLRVTGFFSIVGTSVLNRIVQFVSGMILVRVLSKSDYGAYSYALNIINYFILFNGLGAASCVVQFCVEQESEHFAEEVYRVICWIGIVWDVLLTLSIVLVGCFVDLPMTGANELLLYLAPFPFFTLLVDLQQQRLRSQFRTQQYAWATNLNSVLVVVCSVVGALVASSSGLSVGRSIAMALSVAMVFVIFHVGVFARPASLAKNLIVDVVKMLTTICLSNAVSQALMLVGTSLIGTMLASPESTATYSTATTIPFALAFIPSMVVTYVLPYFVKNAHDRHWVIRYWLICSGVVLIVSSIICITCIALSGKLIPFIFGKQYSDAVPSFCVLMVAFAVASPFRTVSGNILSSHRRYAFNLVSNALSLIICVGVSYLALPRCGAIGAAFGYLAAMIVGSVMNTVGVLVYGGRPKQSIALGARDSER